MMDKRRNKRRHGAASVELTLMLPLMVSMIMGMVELGIAFNGSQKLVAAANSGGRLAVCSEMKQLPFGDSVNQRVIMDVKNHLTLNGLPGHLAAVTITHATGNGLGREFDLSDPDNALELFKIDIWLKYQSLSAFPSNFFGDGLLHDSVVFRAGQAATDE